MEDAQQSVTYRQAGVDIDAGNSLVEHIKPSVASTRRAGVMSDIGGFGGLFDLAAAGFKDPILVSGADGVGTKLKLAVQLGQHQTIGIDLVAMCVNDVLVQGAQPLFFLDYYASSALDVTTASTVVAGIAEGCKQAGCALIGGETAEMPGLYRPGDYDLAGFCVGAVERDDLLTGASVVSGDSILGIASSGAHSNGYSLIRHIVAASGTDLHSDLDGRPLGEHLLAPTHIYVRPVLTMRRHIDLHALAHITGGGLPDNLIRVLPTNLGIQIRTRSWPRPAIFDWLQQTGKLDRKELFRTFNCGIGMCALLPPGHLAQAQRLLGDAGLESWHIGEVVEASGAQQVFMDHAA